MVASNPSNKGMKLLIYVSRAAKILKIMSQGLCIARLIAHFLLLSEFRGVKYSIIPSVMCLRWLAVEFPSSASSSNSPRLVPCSIVSR